MPVPLARILIALIAMSFALETPSTTAFAFSKGTVAATDASVRRLLRLMDKDMDRTVSKDEFFDFLLQRFDQLDVNRNGRLEFSEMRPLKIPNWIWRTSRPTKAVR